MDIHYAERETNYKGDFFMGGNVLLRLNLNKDKVETSKNIRIPVEVCKKMWKIVSKWHENPSCFKEMQIDTKGSGKYTISSYQNDILTAGCHRIAYAEMERMYNEIINA
jgi:ribose 5-phosphate isomerase